MPTTNQVPTASRADRSRIFYSKGKRSDLPRVPQILCHRDRIQTSVSLIPKPVLCHCYFMTPVCKRQGEPCHYWNLARYQ